MKMALARQEPGQAHGLKLPRIAPRRSVVDRRESAPCLRRGCGSGPERLVQALQERAQGGELARAEQVTPVLLDLSDDLA